MWFGAFSSTQGGHFVYVCVCVRVCVCVFVCLLLFVLLFRPLSLLVVQRFVCCSFALISD